MIYSAWFDASVKFKEQRSIISGVIKCGDDKIMEYSADKKYTHDINRLEYLALVELLKKVSSLDIQEIVIHGDNQNVIMNINGLNKIKYKKIQKLAAEARGLLSKINKYEVKWVPRRMNKLADSLLR